MENIEPNDLITSTHFVGIKVSVADDEPHQEKTQSRTIEQKFISVIWGTWPI